MLCGHNTIIYLALQNIISWTIILGHQTLINNDVNSAQLGVKDIFTIHILIYMLLYWRQRMMLGNSATRHKGTALD